MELVTDGFADGGGESIAVMGAPAPLKVLIADDHPLILAGIRRTLESHEDLEVVGTASSGQEALALIERRRPDMVLLDLRMPGVVGFEFIARIKHSWPDVKVVVLSACDDRASVDGALLAGASAYIVKSVNPADVASVLRQASGGSIYHAPTVSGMPRSEFNDGRVAETGPALTERETAILSAVAQGLTTKRISSDLWVSEHTVKFHLTNIYRKLGVANRSGAVRYAIEHGIAA
jgi:DNA-binding NarL/FixJ family response regulator